MPTIHPGHEVLSVFNLGAKNQTLSKNLPSRGLVISLISVFLFVAALGLLLNITRQSLFSASASAAITVSSSEPELAAYQPGQFVTQEISRGYLRR